MKPVLCSICHKTEIDPSVYEEQDKIIFGEVKVVCKKCIETRPELVVTELE